MNEKIIADLLSINTDSLTDTQKEAIKESIKVIKAQCINPDDCKACGNYNDKSRNCNKFSAAMEEITTKFHYQNSYQNLIEEIQKLPLADFSNGNAYIAVSDVLETINRFSYLINPKLLIEAYEKGKESVKPMHTIDGTLIVKTDHIEDTTKVVLENDVTCRYFERNK